MASSIRGARLFLSVEILRRSFTCQPLCSYSGWLEVFQGQPPLSREHEAILRVTNHRRDGHARRVRFRFECRSRRRLHRDAQLFRVLVNHDLQILSDGPAFGGRAGRVVRDHAGGFPVPGQHDFRGGRAARRQFGRESSTLAEEIRRGLELEGLSIPAVVEMLQTTPADGGWTALAVLHALLPRGANTRRDPILPRITIAAPDLARERGELIVAPEGRAGLRTALMPLFPDALHDDVHVPLIDLADVATGERAASTGRGAAHELRLLFEGVTGIGVAARPGYGELIAWTVGELLEAFYRGGGKVRRSGERPGDWELIRRACRWISGAAIPWRVPSGNAPQLRPRVVIVALRKNIADHFVWPTGTGCKPQTVGATLYSLMARRGWKGARAWKHRADDIAPTIVGGSLKHGGPDLGPTRARRAWARPSALTAWASRTSHRLALSSACHASPCRWSPGSKASRTTGHSQAARRPPIAKLATPSRPRWRGPLRRRFIAALPHGVPDRS